MKDKKTDFFDTLTVVLPRRKLRSNESCIILFTKDRPQMLSKTVKGLLDVGMDVIVLDDSRSAETKTAVRKQCRADNFFYHSQDKQAIFLESLKRFIVNVDGFMRSAGIFRKHGSIGRKHGICLRRWLLSTRWKNCRACLTNWGSRREEE